jgi:hypothetical protein
LVTGQRLKREAIEKGQKPGLVVNIYNPTTGWLRQEDGEFETRLVCITRPCHPLPKRRSGYQNPELLLLSKVS